MENGLTNLSVQSILLKQSCKKPVCASSASKFAEVMLYSLHKAVPAVLNFINN